MHKLMALLLALALLCSGAGFAEEATDGANAAADTAALARAMEVYFSRTFRAGPEGFQI